jgi:16S rRNA (guanine(966)-N(2))-methyltransferase RsmD
MRIIAGEYKGRVLKSPADSKTRPTSDRLRETLFNILSPRIAGARFLDLCAGSGAVGIEALSRGALHSTFVDLSRKMTTLIQSNLDLCRILKDRYEVVISDATEFLKRRQNNSKDGWDIIFFDPPYTDDYTPTLSLFSENTSSLINKDGILITEHYRKNNLPEELNALKRFRTLRQGDSCLSFYEQRS